MPDSSTMQELCNILDVTVNEPLSGERIPFYMAMGDHFVNNKKTTL